jgi:hypothetical protein|tara:strand:- start:615 stop:872 length:258 start_codon:yes stop_codon:yes gene_type:complete
MGNPNVTKVADVMHKAEKLVAEELKKNPGHDLLVAAGLMAVTRNLYIRLLGPAEAQKIFAVMLDSFIMADEMYYGENHDTPPTIH